MIDDAKKAMKHWLNNRIPDTVSECHWRIAKAVELSNLEHDHKVYTEEFEVSFNIPQEAVKLKEYLNKSGYTVEMEFSGDNTAGDNKDLRWKIRIGF